MRQLIGNLGAIILALLLAFVVWISASLQDDPFADREFPDVPISLLNRPERTELVAPLEERVTVTVRARRSVLAELETDDFQATMDLSGVEPGKPGDVPILVTCDNPDVRIERWTPAAQTVHLEAVRTITLPVKIKVQGKVAVGYQMTVPQAIPKEVALTGPESVLAQVTSVVGVIDVSDARETINEQVAVKPINEEGKTVVGLDQEPERVQVQVAIRRKLGFKPDVEVVPDLVGEPAADYRLGSVSVEPSTVTLAGLPSVLNDLPGFIETQPISVSGATEGLVQYSPLVVPEGVVVVGVDYVTVTVEVLPIQSSRAMTSVVEVQGVRPGWVATPSPEVVDVILEGPNTILESLTPDDIRIILNLFDYPLGVHRIAPSIAGPEGVTVVSIIPETIEVVIEIEPTPTPTVTVTAEP